MGGQAFFQYCECATVIGSLQMGKEIYQFIGLGPDVWPLGWECHLG